MAMLRGRSVFERSDPEPAVERRAEVTRVDVAELGRDLLDRAVRVGKSLPGALHSLLEQEPVWRLTEDKLEVSLQREFVGAYRDRERGERRRVGRVSEED